MTIEKKREKTQTDEDEVREDVSYIFCSNSSESHDEQATLTFVNSNEISHIPDFHSSCSSF